MIAADFGGFGAAFRIAWSGGARSWGGAALRDENRRGVAALRRILRTSGIEPFV